jgi:type IV secretory pathway VirB4 component
MTSTHPTQSIVDIKKIERGVIYLNHGGLRKIVAVGGVNFDLKSLEEQEILLRSFQNFLNTLDFSIQFFIHSRKVNISSHLAEVGARKNQEKNELLRLEIDDYIRFISTFVAENPIISKSFFIVVPYETRSDKAKKGVFSIFKKSSSKTKEEEKALDERQALLQLEQRVDEIVSGLESLGLHTDFLDDHALVELFYNLYNPTLVEKEISDNI